MTARKGTNAFTTKESSASEKRSQNTLSRIISELEFKDFSIDFSGYSVDEVYGTKIAINKNGKPARTFPDFGLILYKGKLVGFGDNKYQKSSQNACERVSLYHQDSIAMGLDPKRVLIVLDGPGFSPHNDEGHIPGSTGKQVVRCKSFFTTLVNPTEQELYDGIRQYLRRIMREEGSMGILGVAA